MKIFIVEAENRNINKRAKFLIYASDAEEVRSKFGGTFIAQSGMEIISIFEAPDFYLL